MSRVTYILSDNFITKIEKNRIVKLSYYEVDLPIELGLLRLLFDCIVTVDTNVVSTTYNLYRLRQCDGFVHLKTFIEYKDKSATLLNFSSIMPAGKLVLINHQIYNSDMTFCEEYQYDAIAQYGRSMYYRITANGKRQLVTRMYHYQWYETPSENSYWPAWIETSKIQSMYVHRTFK